jgi:hypothetical protein
MTVKFVPLDSLPADPGYQKYLQRASRRKEKMPPAVCGILQRWVQSGDSLNFTTFQYIVAFFVKGEEHERLPVACADFGYSREELRQMKAQGKTAIDIAVEIIDRGVDNDE